MTLTIDVGLGNIMEGAGSDNQVDPSHGASNGSFIILSDVVRIM